MRFTKLGTVIACLILISGLQARAQVRNEIAVSLGGGSLRTDPGGGATAVFSISYQLHITSHFAAEGALDTFFYRFLAGPASNPYTYNDDYLGAEAAAVYYFRRCCENARFLPFVVAGVGKTTTDFTEIAAHPYYRLGAGVAYHLTDRLGLRLEVRDEIIKSLAAYGTPDGNLPSIRGGIVFRF